MISTQSRGLVIGLVLGVAWMWLGFGPALLIAFMGLLGWLVGSAVAGVAAGNVRMVDLWNDLRGRRAGS